MKEVKVRWDERGRGRFDNKPAAKLRVRQVVLVTRLGPSSQVSVETLHGTAVAFLL